MPTYVFFYISKIKVGQPLQMMAVPTGVVLLLEGFIGEVCLLRCEFM
jgi:hypothetical protein